MPLVHTCPEGHALPQAPQWATLDARAVSQPSLREVLQSPKPVLHTKPQVLIAQAARALLAAGQTVPQAPQWEGSRVVLTQAMPQAVSPALQLTWHMRLEHT